MGTVNFLTDVTKTVDITKTVDLTVTKDVFSSVSVVGNLATAEASADAVGSGTTGDGERIKIPFNVDGFTDGQILTANATIGPDPASDGPQLVADTEIANLQRTLFADVLSDEGQTVVAVNDVLPGKLSFDQGNNTFANAFADYDIPGGFDPFPFDDNAGIVQDFLDNVDPLAADPLADVCYTFIFSDIDWDAGQTVDGASATVRVSFLVEDTSGNSAITTVAFVPGDDGSGFQDLTIAGSFAGLIDETLAPAPGTVLAVDAGNNAQIVVIGTEDDADGNGNSVDFDNLSGFQILLEDDPEIAVGGNTFSSADFFAFDSVIDESVSVDGTDASTQFDWTTCIVEEEFGLLAETDTFAQVQPGGAFSFSESLAASTAVEEDLIA